MSKQRVCIQGTGSYAPEKILTNADLEKMVDTTDEWIVTRSGIRERHISTDDQATSDMATPAALRACEAAGVEPADLDAIIVGTATGDRPFPSTAVVVQANIGASNAYAFDVSAACSGFLFGLSVGRSIIHDDRAGTVLVIGAETLTKVTDWVDRSSCVLFGDGAGAVILQKTDEDRGILSINTGSDGTLQELLYQPAGGSRMPASHETVDQRLHTIKMEGREVFKHAVTHMSEAALKALADAGYEGPDLDWLFPHQANLRIMEAVAKRIRVPRERVFVNLDRYGNTSAASIPIALDEAVRGGHCGPGALIELVAFGAGFTWAAAVVRL
ncbi:MAG: ketoacyl-ACP synthase III [Candidatus Eisenbacteria bacterium]|nr:ketoacyl-ACP synthase III [Candidatus Eisenbacteria bacterium]